MEQVLNIFTSIRAVITPEGGNIAPGSAVVIDANVPATILYTLDGSEPRALAVGTAVAEAPVEIVIASSTRVRYKAFDSRPLFRSNATKTQEATFIVDRLNPAEAFRDTNNFYRRLLRSIVDSNFYLTEGRWVLPTSTRPFTYLFRNREPYFIRLRVLHNGVDVFSEFPSVSTGGVLEVPITPISGENRVEIQTAKIGSGSPALYDEGLYDEDVYA